MKYIKAYEYYIPIKVNSAKPFKVKKNLDKSIKYVQKGIKSLRRRLDDPKNKEVSTRSKMNNDVNDKIKKLKDLEFKKLKQQEYFRNNPIVESTENTENLITILESEDFKPLDIMNYIGLPEDKYDFVKEYNWRNGKNEVEYKCTKDGFCMLINSKTLEDLMDTEDGVIKYLLEVSNYYGGSEYDASGDMDYLNSYLTEESLNRIKKLAILFDYNLDLDDDEHEGTIVEFFNYLGLSDDVKNFQREIEMENERAIDKAATKLLKSVPFNISSEYTGDFNLELYFDYDDMIAYMKKHDMDVKTIEEFLENLYEASDFSYDFENEGKNEFLDNYDDLEKEVNNTVDNYLKSPDEIFPKLIEVDNLELFRKKVDMALFDYEYDIHIDYNKKNMNLFQMVRHFNGEICKWLQTKEFEKFIMNQTDGEVDAYQKFIFEGDVEKYGL